MQHLDSFGPPFPPTLMDVSPEEIRKKCPQFRVLVMGRRNAGKTTILRRMAGAEDNEAYQIRSPDGYPVRSRFHMHAV